MHCDVCETTEEVFQEPIFLYVTCKKCEHIPPVERLHYKSTKCGRCGEIVVYRERSKKDIFRLVSIRCKCGSLVG